MIEQIDTHESFPSTRTLTAVKVRERRLFIIFYTDRKSSHLVFFSGSLGIYSESKSLLYIDSCNGNLTIGVILNSPKAPDVFSCWMLSCQIFNYFSTHSCAFSPWRVGTQGQRWGALMSRSPHNGSQLLLPTFIALPSFIAWQVPTHRQQWGALKQQCLIEKNEAHTNKCAFSFTLLNKSSSLTLKCKMTTLGWKWPTEPGVRC